MKSKDLCITNELFKIWKSHLILPINTNSSKLKEICINNYSDPKAPERSFSQSLAIYENFAHIYKMREMEIKGTYKIVIEKLI